MQNNDLPRVEQELVETGAAHVTTESEANTDCLVREHESCVVSATVVVAVLRTARVDVVRAAAARSHCPQSTLDIASITDRRTAHARAGPFYLPGTVERWNLEMPTVTLHAPSSAVSRTRLC